MIVAARMDGVLLVVRVGETRKGALNQTVEMMEHARARVVGLVYNQVPPRGSGYYYYSYYSYPYGNNGQQNGHRRNGRNGKRPHAVQPEEAVASLVARVHRSRR